MSLVNIKQIDNQNAQGNSTVTFDGEKNIWQKLRYHQAFNYGNLINGKIVINHSLLRKYVQVILYDDNDFMVTPDEIHLIDDNSLEIDLTSFGNHVTDFNVVIT